MSDCKVVAKLNAPGWHDCIKRIYSAEGCSPTIPTAVGGGHIPKILVEKTSEKRIIVVLDSVSIPNRVYGGGGLCPCQRASQYKDPIKVLVDDEPP